MKKNEKSAVEVAQVENVENATVVASVEPKSSLDTLKAEMQKMAQEMAEKKAQMAESLKALKEEAARLKDLEKAQKEEAKKLESADRAKKMADALAKLGSEITVNKTQTIKTLLLEGKSLDEIVKSTSWSRKEISDRIWLIEKKLGIR